MTDTQMLPPPQGPEYARCFGSGCGHIEPEHRPYPAGPCLVCDCTAYRPVPAAVPAAVEPPAGQTTPSHRAGLREQLAAALYERERPPRDPHWPKAFAADREVFEATADAVLAVLYREWPWLRAEAEDAKPADQAAVDLETARATNQRLNREKQRLESELAAYRRAVSQWEISERGTYVPLRSLAGIAKAAGIDVPARWQLHYERVERAEAERDSLGREADRLRKDWVGMRDRAERAEADRATVLREAADQLDQYVGLQSSDAAPEVEGARLVIRELRRIAERSQPAVEPGTCGHRSPEGRLCNRAAGHLGYHRRTQPDSDGWTSWVADLPGEAQAVLRRMADETATTDIEASLADGPVHCPLCPTPLTLHTPSGARAHFTTVHPEQRITGRESGPWPLLVADETATNQTPPERVKHSGPDSKFCVLCLSGEHERVDDEPAAGARQDGSQP